MPRYAGLAKCDIPADTPSLSAEISRFEAIFCDIAAETGLTSAGKSHFDAIATVIQRSYRFGGG